MPSTPSYRAVSHALAENRIGTLGIGMSIASSVAPLTVVAGLVTTALAVTGLRGVPIAMVAVAIVLLLFVVGYLAMARHIENAGAFYAYVARGIGRPPGVGASWVALLAYNAFQIASIGGVGIIAAPLIKNWFGIDLNWFIVSAVAWLIAAFLGVRDVGVSEKVLVVLVIAETVLVVVYSVVIMTTSGFHFSSAPLSLGNLWGPGSGAMLVIAGTAFAGSEQGAVYVEESRNPRRTVPRATYGAIILITAVYFIASWAQISAAGSQIIQRAGKEGPDLFFNEAAVSMGNAALDIGHVLFLSSLVATTIAFHNIIARYTFALGREGVLPRMFGRTTAKGAPRNASVAQSLLAIIVLLIYFAAGWDPLVNLFFWGGTTGGLGVLLLITLTSIAVIGYFARNHHDGSPWIRLIAPVIATVLLLIISYLALTNLAALFGVAKHSGPAIVVPIAYAGVFTGGIIWGLVLKGARPNVYAGVGQGTRSAAASGSRDLSALLDDEPSGSINR